MNYLHDYHAGNFADCFKHALLLGLLDALHRKPAPFFVLDTHAGAGRYDLGSEAARRSGEAEAGIQRLLRTRPAALDRFLTTVERIGLYPGSPALIADGLREQDQLACCEMQPEVVGRLRSTFRSDPRVHVHQRSGWEALSALLPPKQRRGLVFIDPPFENPGEFGSLASGLLSAHRRFGQATVAGWFPIKRLATVRAFHAEMIASEVRDVMTVELCLRDPTDPTRLNGCGLLVINPPYQFEVEASRLAEAVLAGLGDAEPGCRAGVVRLADE